MFIWKQTTPGIALNSYLIGDKIHHECVVIDPSLNFEPLIAKAQEKNCTITKIIETHIHADFVSGAYELKQALKGKPTLIISGENSHKNNYGDLFVKNGASFKVGGLRLEAFFTPGHTPEHLSWLLFDEKKSKTNPVAFFTGDFIFAGAIGRPDLLGGNNLEKLSQELYESCFSRLAHLPGELEIYPSHGAGSSCGKAISGNEMTTLEIERQRNPSLQEKPFQEWAKDLLTDMPNPPAYFFRVKKINASANPPEIKETFEALSPEVVFKRIKEGALILDIRNKDAFVKSHIPGSLFISLNSQFLSWAGWLLPENAPIIILSENLNETKKAASLLKIIGFDNVIGTVEGGLQAWQKAALPLSTLTEIEPSSLNLSATQVIDVRTPDEWDRGHIEGARHDPLTHFQTPAFAKETNLTTVCQGGYRATIAASLLLRAGFQNTQVLKGGMDCLRPKLLARP